MDGGGLDCFNRKLFEKRDRILAWRKHRKNSCVAKRAVGRFQMSTVWQLKDL